MQITPTLKHKSCSVCAKYYMDILVLYYYVVLEKVETEVS